MDTTSGAEVQPPNHHIRLDTTSGAEVPLSVRAPPNNQHIDGHYVSSDARGRESIPLVDIMIYMVASVLVIVALKYQAKPEGLFTENPAPLRCFVAATIVYWLIVAVMKHFTTISAEWREILSRAALASAILSAISLVSMFLPYPVSLVPLLTWILVPVVLAWPNTLTLLHRGIEAAGDKIYAIIVWARRQLNSTERASSPA